MASIADANYVLAGAKTYDDGQILDELDLDNAYNYFQTYINARKNDLQKLANDAFGTTYVLDGNATPVLSNSLFEKQTALLSLTAIDFSIGTSVDVSFANVDGTNAIISFTPELAGTYKIVFDFVHAFTLNATSEGQCITRFRITNSSGDVYHTTKSGGYFPATAANAITIFQPIHMEVIQSVDTNPITFFLQKQNISMTNVSSNIVACSVTNGTFRSYAEKV